MPIDKDEARKHFQQFMRGCDDCLHATKPLAQILAMFDPGEFGHVMEWLFGEFMEIKIQSLIPRVEQIYQILVERKYTEKHPHTCNDMEDDLFYLPHRKFKVFAATTQNINYVVIIEPAKVELLGIRLHVRQYWDELREGMDYEIEELKKGGIKAAVAKAEFFCDRYSDYFPDSRFVSRPSLKWFKDRKFDLAYKEKLHHSPLSNYGDCRDEGYVLTSGTGYFAGSTDLHYMISFYRKISHFFWLMGTSLETLLDGGETK